jgi:integrase
MSLFKTAWGWRYQFEHQGNRYSRSGFATKREAQAAREKHRAEVAQQQPIKQEGLDLLTLAAEYLDATQGQLTPKTWKYKRYVANCFLTHAGNLPLDQVTPFIVEKYILTRPSRHNANVHRKDLSAMFAWGVERGLAPENPVAKVKKLGVDKAPRKVYTPEEIERLFNAAGEHLLLLQVMYYTMGRRGEILGLRWRDVDFARQTITLWTRKRQGGGLQPDTLPMGDDLTQVLQDLHEKRIQDEWVFYNKLTGTRFNTRTKTLKTICQKAGVPYYGYHVIRHFVASYLAHVGKESMKSMQSMLRHKSLRTTEIYLHSIEDDMKRVADRIPSPINLCGSEAHNRKTPSEEGAYEVGDR